MFLTIAHFILQPWITTQLSQLTSWEQWIQFSQHFENDCSGPKTAWISDRTRQKLDSYYWEVSVPNNNSQSTTLVSAARWEASARVTQLSWELSERARANAAESKLSVFERARARFWQWKSHEFLSITASCSSQSRFSEYDPAVRTTSRLLHYRTTYWIIRALPLLDNSCFWEAHPGQKPFNLLNRASW